MASPAPTAAYKDALLALHAQQRARLSVLVQQTEAMLHSDWQRGMGAAASLYRPVLDEYAKALSALRLANDDPAAKLSLDWLTSQNKALASIEQSVRASALKYGDASVQTVRDAQLKAMNAGLQDAENLTQEALWPASQVGIDPAMLFNRPNPDAISQMVGRAGNGHPLGDLFANFPQEAASGARQALLMGLATGANPVHIASGIQQAMGISRSRAITIARTEVLGSYRAAAHETYRANSDVLGYWLWSAGGNNPCAMCAGMDGTLHDLSEDLVDHPCGRCAPLPVTKPWDEILGPYGIDASDLEETSIGAPGNYTSISQKFDRYPAAKQREIIGTQTGYEAYKNGELTLKDFIGVRPAADGFPSSYYQKSLRELQIPTRQASRLVQPSSEIMEKLRLGTLRYTDLGKITPDELMPAWAKANESSRIVYQILRNGLPYDMMAHEQGLLVTNLAQMLREDLPVNVRAAVERQLQALGQTVERLTLKSAKLADITAATESATFNIARMDTEAFARETRDALDLIRPADAAANELRAQVSRDLAARLADNPEFVKVGDRFAELFARDLKAKGYSEAEIAQAMATTPKTPEAIARTLLQRWASSNDSVYPALQQAIRDELGLDARLSTNTAGMADWADVQPGLRAFARAMYENTQDFLREHDILEMPLYRGTGFETLPKSLAASIFEGQPQTVEMSLRAASSFTADVEQALEFARLPVSNAYEDINYELVMAARVPREMIFSIPQTGFGVLDESEVIVLGGEQSLMAIGAEVANGSLDADKAASLFTANVERQAEAKAADTLAGARGEVRDAQKALSAALDAARADFSRNPQGLLSSALENDGRVLRAQARLETAQARVSELKDAAKAAKTATPTIETEATRSAERELTKEVAEVAERGITSAMPDTTQTASDVEYWLSTQYRGVAFDLVKPNGAYDYDFIKALSLEELRAEGVGPRFMTDGTAQEIGKLFDQLAKEYPVATKNLEYVGLQEGVTPEMAARWGVAPGGGFAEAGPKGEFLVLSSEWRDLAQLDAKMGINKGFTLEGGDNPAGIFTHEFGHLVESAIRELPAAQRAPYEAWLAKYPYQESAVSQYARKTAEEHFAENFAALKFGSAEIRALPEVRDFEAMLQKMGIEKRAGQVVTAAEEKTVDRAVSQQALDALSAAQQSVDKLRAEYDAAIARGVNAFDALPEDAHKAMLDLARAQAQADLESGGRGAVILAYGTPSPFDALDALQQKTEEMFGRALSNDDLGGLVGAPQGAHVNFYVGEGRGLAIHVNGPSWEGPYTYSPSEYSADRMLMPAVRGDGFVMSNNGFVIRDDLQGQGIGARIFADQAQSLSRLGNVKYIETEAARTGELWSGGVAGSYNGYYSWPRMGYVGTLPDAASANIQAAIARGDIAAKYGNFTTVQQFMRSEEGRAIWTTYGSDINLTFDMRPNSLSMRTLTAYLKAKGLL